MALSGSLSLVGAKQGAIEGESLIRGREGALEVMRMLHRIVGPRDPSSGLATGKRVHTPIILTTPVDMAAPMLYQALCTNETLTFWKLRLFRPSPDGREHNYLDIELTDASLCGIKLYLPNTRDPQQRLNIATLEVRFVYRRIEWHHLDSNVVAADDWLSASIS